MSGGLLGRALALAAEHEVSVFSLMQILVIGLATAVILVPMAVEMTCDWMTREQ